MEQLISQAPNTPLGFLALFASIILLCLYAFNKIRENDLKVLREANNDLRSSIEDKGKKIEDLTAKVHELETELIAVKTHSKSLEDLVILALKDYFTQNPQAAISISGRLKKG